jgi:hypothetical protein
MAVMSRSEIGAAFRRAGALALLGALCGAAFPQGASAQFFFRPFGGLFYGPARHGPPPIYSRRAVAVILAREGYRLVGPVERRGPRLVAHGVGPSGDATRFFIDAYDGSIVSSWDETPMPGIRRGVAHAAQVGGRPDEVGQDEPHVIEAPREAPGAALPRAGRPAASRGPGRAPGVSTAPVAPPVAAAGNSGAPVNRPDVATDKPAAGIGAPAGPGASALEKTAPAAAGAATPAPRSSAHVNPAWSTRRAVAPPRPGNQTPAAPGPTGAGASVPTVAPAPPLLPPAPKVSPILGAGKADGAGG